MRPPFKGYGRCILSNYWDILKIVTYLGNPSRNSLITIESSVDGIAREGKMLDCALQLPNVGHNHTNQD
jgi:hypothetical protein